MHIVPGSDTRYWRLGKESVDRLYERYGSGVRVSGRIYSVRTAVEMLAKGNSGEVICGEHLQSADCGTFAWTGVEQFVCFLLKIKQISEAKYALDIAQRTIFEIIRILFRYADNHSELCCHEKGELPYMLVWWR